MAHLLDDETKAYSAVINAEGQYSFWPAERDPPLGWNRIGPIGTRQETLAYIGEVWRDMRPNSLKRAMEMDAHPERADAR